MQVIMKITERQRKSKAGLKQLFNYISRDNFKCAGVGVSDNKEIAFKQFLINKSLFGKDTDNKNRFTYHQILSFGADIDKETVFKITEEYCQKNFLEKGFNSFFAIHTDKENIHCHILIDNVNYKTGKMLQSLTEKQYNKEVRKQNKEEVYIYEKQRELFENICIEHGLDISEKERYKSMHEEKEKEGRKWLTKEQYRAIKDKDSWRNIIKGKLEEIYKRVDLREDNIKEIAKEYQLEVTRHNTKNKTITFALVDLQGKPTKERIKLERLEEQESELNRSKDKENIFEYDIFFKGREKEEEKTREETIKIEAPDEDKEKDKKDFEKEKEYKNILDNFFEEQEEKKKEQDSKAKKLEEEVKDIEKAEIDKITQADEVLRRLNIEEEERQAESKAKQEEEKKKDNRPLIFDRLKDFETLTDELELLEFEREHRLTYSSTDIEKDFNNAVYLAFYSLISRKVEFNNQKEADRANSIMENVEKNNDDESIRRNLDLLDELIKDNEKEYERLKKNNWREEEEVAEEKARLEREKREQEQKNEEDKSVTADELTPNIKTENETSKKVSNNQPTEITEFETGKSVGKDLLTDEDLEKNIENLSHNYSEIIIEKYNLYENLPAFKIYSESGSEIFNNKTGYIAEDYIISIIGQEYWDNMDINNIKDWENLGVIIAYGSNENQYTDYADYAEETVINYLKSNPGKVKELESEFNSQLSTPGKSNKTIQEEEKEIEKNDKEMDI
ncbi:relaxase/mobilization nuclease domain-containing protein [Fusobacterium polymorphum]|uniref:relaxase/mobilization nuclease domain-containing protein n=2 Tax=Fusobacterium nucleatum subsp. polymorphum TaxID=76857 RepID=UPI002B4BBFA7|nr:relaxase/mobilization nuclease domain-containing protein [Fusobacterium polymorphum]WRL76568.1 relaxase/mobilization nuclease domain-containing protein [Fusobacterium polymorphum]